MEQLKVIKYGGATLAGLERVCAVADRIAQRWRSGERFVLVLSAMGEATDHLSAQAHQISDDPDPREMDALLATGEQVSVSLMAIALNSRGIKAKSFFGPHIGIRTDARHTHANILDIDPHEIARTLAEGKLPVVAGFQGIAEGGELTTLGRGGSDTTAVALAGALHASRCLVLKDVEGVFTADPNIVREARRLDAVSYEEMMGISDGGAKVLEPKSVAIARTHKIPVQVTHFIREGPGTEIRQLSHEELCKRAGRITSVTLTQKDVIVNLRRLPEREGVSSKVLPPLAEAGIRLDMITKAVDECGLASLSFAVLKEDLHNTIVILDKTLSRLGKGELGFDPTLARVSIIGVGMMNQPGVASKMFAALAENDIPIQHVASSEIKISCMIEAETAYHAVKVIHEAFL